ncbi:DNA adenine methylase [Methanobacterium sp.]|uniref:DNA adenine methylase n=1 Tax=Methanobacterium sp. TaxID=2164 RepID=UPI002ABCA1F4|nr:DNA adenine methylase [Methanobacterium sp.]MDY9922692.1 DNA adenine methylase [Methanobacterium sp.]
MAVKKLKEKFNGARPFLKWAGGKTQLLLELEKRLPQSILENGIIEMYVEPFVGGGAMFFYLKNQYQINDTVLLDVNPELIMAYRVIQRDVDKLITILGEMEIEHLQKDEVRRKENFYRIRTEYNRQMPVMDYQNYADEWIQRTASLIFLNKTCFNGLFRLNSKGEFNVPFGRYKNPTICDEGNLQAVHQALKKTEILCADFTHAQHFIKKDTLVYMDPPYRPLNSTSHFTSYSRERFSDQDQEKLARFYREMDLKGAHLILSNSDPKNHDVEDNFFDELYQGYEIDRVPAKRNINSNTSSRGEINELIIRNFQD